MKIQNKSFLVSLILAVLIASFFPVKVDAYSTQNGHPQEEIEKAIIKGLDYIAGQTNEDGGIRWIDETSSVAATIRFVQALSAAGYPQDFIKSETGNSPIDFLAIQGWDWVNQVEAEEPGFNVARAGQLLTAIAAANKNPHSFGDKSNDFIAEINRYYDQNSGIYGKAAPGDVLDQVWAIIGLAANNASVPAEAADWLALEQADDGSWNDGFGSFLDTTPLAVIALIGSKHYVIDSPSIQSALNFIEENQKEDGGWQSDWDTATNPNTTGVILQAISSLGQYPTNDNWQQPQGDPQTALLAVQQENGIFGGEFGNAYSTADAIIGLSGRHITSLGFLVSASEAFDYLFETQGSDGGWGNVGQTLDVMIALNAAGWQPSSVTSDGRSPLDFISENLTSYIEAGPDAVGKSILGITAAGMDPRDFNGTNLGSRLLETYDEASQAFGSPENTWHQAFGILGLHSMEMEIPQGAVETLTGLQMEDGGWEYSTAIGASPDSTALVLQALLASGFSGEDKVITTAIDYLKDAQLDDGGWGDSSTTSFVIMALNALGQTSDNWTSDLGKLPVANLMTFQKANGAFVYSWEFMDDSIMSTASALMALFGGDYLIKLSEMPEENYSAIVIDPEDSEVQNACVSFDEESITGLDLLEKSGIDYQTDQDGFLTSIMDISNPEGETNYWSYWYWDGREWQFQNTGASNTRVLPGSIELWHFTSWEQFPSLPSEYIPDIFEICGEDILADYSQQPYLDYNNLFSNALQEPIGLEVTPETPAQDSTDEATKTVTIEPSEEQDESEQSSQPTEEDQRDGQEQESSLLAIIVIAVVGVIMVISLAVFYLRRRK